MAESTSFWDELAIQSYKTILKQKPEHPVIHHNLGLAYVRTGDLKKAASSFRKATRYDKSYAEAYYHLATTLQRLGNSASAIRAFGHYNRIQSERRESTPIVAEMLSRLNIETGG